MKGSIAHGEETPNGGLHGMLNNTAKAVAMLAGAILMAATGATRSEAFCIAPSLSESPPDAPGTMSRPDVPFCLEQMPHTCEQYEVDAYVEAVNDYIATLNQYMEEANTFAESAASFANDAAAYAKCERDEVVSRVR